MNKKSKQLTQIRSKRFFDLNPEQRFEQYFTYSQFSLHFFLQLNGSLQTIQTLDKRFSGVLCIGM